MNIKRWITCLVFLLTAGCARNLCPVPEKLETTPAPPACAREIDALLQSGSSRNFNGIILVSRGGFPRYLKMTGFADLEKQTPLCLEDQFVIGSISKQITAVLVLREQEKGTLSLDEPIHTYLPDLTRPWARIVTVHDLLTHQHGITEPDKPLAFKPGTRFQYSQIGYELLADILEAVTRRPFEDLSSSLFAELGMKGTFHPATPGCERLVRGYTERDGTPVFETASFENYVPAGSFISSAGDLARWNDLLYGGQILSDASLELMSRRHATRQHPIFGDLEYGLGLTFKKDEGHRQIGAVGFAPGFVSSNYYFPQTGTSVVILENVVRGFPDFGEVFFFHTEILRIVNESLPAR